MEELQWPNPTDYSNAMLRIIERSQKLVQEFVERNQSAHGLFPAFDPKVVVDAYAELGKRILSSPERLVDAQLALWQDYLHLWQYTLARMQGKEPPPLVQSLPNDRRFQDQAWHELWYFDFIKQSYLLTTRWLQNLIYKADGLDEKIRRKLDFFTRQMADAIAPSNFWMTNPEVLRTTIETGGENLLRGLEHLLDDLERGHGQLIISMTDTKAFRLGENIATTSGKVIFQNELMQLIQYAPLTEKVHKVPMLIVPPWINKYYVLDLKQKNSFIRYLVEQGHTVFCISWVNPDSRHAEINFDDYMALGILAAMREIQQATGEPSLNVTGYCIGGTLLACTLAYLKTLDKKQGKKLPEIASASYLVTLIDFSEPGDISVFIDETQIRLLEARMAQQGYLDAHAMAMTFNLLRANDLIWSFVVNNYLMGREPFPFDLLYWNSDSTNLPAAMQSFYLRNMYLENRMIQPAGIKMKEAAIDLRAITTPSFCLATRDDHIAPWRTVYAATQTYAGPVKFVLSGSGHIAGVINPPDAKKYAYWTTAADTKYPTDPEEWFKTATSTEGSWWPTWIEWLKPFGGTMVSARQPQNPLEDAPGSYVRVRAV